MRLVGKILLNRYFLRELAGSGGMAEVYLAWDKLRSTKMAIKVLRSELAGDSRFFKNFSKEAELLKKLEHPNIVRLYDFDRDGDVVFIVMDWVEGMNLRRSMELRGNKPFSLDEVSNVITSLASALHYAHQLGIFHCDVKPANILLHNDGRVLITDFGVAQVMNERVGGGTPPYMAPEQFLGKPINAQTDIYAVGIMVFELLSGGKLPFIGKYPDARGTSTKERIGWEHINLPVPSLREINASIPEGVEQVIQKALQKDPNLRFSSIVEFRDVFERACLESRLPRREITKSRTVPTSQVLQKHTTLPTTSTPFDLIAKVGGKDSVNPNQNNSHMINLKSPQNNLANKVSDQLPLKSQRPISGPVLVVRQGDLSSRTIPIPLGELTVGRGRQNAIQLIDQSVSRRHATFIRTRKGTYIRDEGSRFGTLINGQRIPPMVSVLLNSGDTIRFGHNQVIEFFK